MDKDLDVYKKYMSTLHLFKNISNTLSTIDIQKIPTQFIIIKDLVLREENINNILDFIGQEIIALEDENTAIEHNMVREYSHGAGLHPATLPKIINLNVCIPF